MAEQDDHPLRIEGDFNDGTLVLLEARIEEGINRLSQTDIDFVCTKGAQDLESLVGKEVRVVAQLPGKDKRVFPGLCVSAEYVGNDTGLERYRAELRPWFWLLSRTADSRVYQNVTIPDLFQNILGEYGFSGQLDKKLSGTYPNREYILQYRETDLDFLTRIAEEEGMYFFFIEKDGKDHMVLADSVGAHTAIEGETTIPYRPRADAKGMQIEHICEWKGGRTSPTGRITLKDYNFEKPKADLTVASQKPKGKHSHKDYEVYDYPGKYAETSDGERLAKFRMEAEAIDHHKVRAAGTVSRFRVGHKFTLAEHPRATENAEYLITRLSHRLKLADYVDLDFIAALMPPEHEDGPPADIAMLEAVPASEQYRHRAVTPKPVIAGVQTATVTGPSGEEIHTDKYGRIKVLFHWDREGKPDDTASCWVRVMMPWTGKNWGMMHVPRIGQEVVVQFEEGDPDRPLVIGMLYNAETMPPWALDANKTQSGIKTNTTKGGGGFNELMMEDKKGAELVRFQSERDYRQIVKNDAEITVGLEHKDKGDMALTVHNDLTETVKEGNHAFKVEKGEQTIDIAKDQTEKVGGDRTQTVTGKKTTTVKGASYEVKVSAGEMKITAATKITLSCGSSKIEMTPTEIKLSSVMISVEASATLKTNGNAMAEHKAGGMMTIRGALVNIN